MYLLQSQRYGVGRSISYGKGITGGHCSRMKRYPKKEHINFIEPHMWPPIALILIPWITLFGCSFSN